MSMFFEHLNNSRKKVFLFLIPFFLISILSTHGEAKTSSFSDPYNEGTVFLDQLYNLSLSLNSNTGEVKTASQFKIITIFNIGEKKYKLNSSALYSNNIKNESILNFRLRSFITSHFASST